jgi:hypothetical protein
LFLRDTQTIHDFIMDNGVSFSVDDATPLDGVDRQTLRATGPEESIGKLAKLIEERRNVGLRQAPTPHDPDIADYDRLNHHLGVDT